MAWAKKTSGKEAGEIAGFRLGLPENHSRMTEKLEHVVTTWSRNSCLFWKYCTVNKDSSFRSAGLQIYCILFFTNKYWK
jgi:hypothetical protein